MIAASRLTVDDGTEMLILRRCFDESVLISTPDGHRLTVWVRRSKNGVGIDLGFDGPRDVFVVRRGETVPRVASVTAPPGVVPAEAATGGA